MPLFDCPPEYREALETVKREVGIHHHYLDGWVYLFLSNKKYDIKETVAKLQRRDVMEKTVFSNYTITPSLKESMRAGIVQYIGRDKLGRPVLYFNTARDHPKAEQRPERQANMDMFLSWSVRCSQENPTSSVTWLINQKDASMMKNTDLIFQKDMALRISKFFPGVVARMYICNMSSTLTFVMKPLLKQLPSAISDCIFMFSAGDIRKGKLQEYIDPSVLPVDMGGNNDCDNQKNYNLFATTIESYFADCIAALKKGITIKEMEMMKEFNVDSKGVPIAPSPQPPKAEEKSVSFAPEAKNPSKSVDPSDSLTSNSKISVSRKKQIIVVCSSTLYEEQQQNNSDNADRRESVAPEELDGEELLYTPTSPNEMVYFSSRPDFEGAVGEEHDSPIPNNTIFATPNFDAISESCVSNALMRSLSVKQDKQDEMERDWVRFRCYCLEICPYLFRLLGDLKDDAVGSEALSIIEENGTLLRRICHHVLNLFPQTKNRLSLPLIEWVSSSFFAKYELESEGRAYDSVVDCTSPDNLLLSVQGGLMEYIEECNTLIEVDKFKERVLRRMPNMWTAQLTREDFVTLLHDRCREQWNKLVPLFQSYIETKVTATLGHFVEHYGLLVSGGGIDTGAEWYKRLHHGLVQFREMKRGNWLFHVFPPAFQEEDAYPSMKEILRAAKRSQNLSSVSTLSLMSLSSLLFTRDELRSSLVSLVNPTLVERYLEAQQVTVYIPYESQQEGVSPNKVIEAARTEAIRCLSEAESVLREFLFTNSILFLLETRWSSSSDRASCLEEAAALRRYSLSAIQARRECQTYAVHYTKGAYDLQASFGEDTFGFLKPTDMPPDGYLFALELLAVDAFVQQRKNAPNLSNDSFVMEDMRSALKRSTNTGDRFTVADAQRMVTCLHSMDSSARLLAAVKRQFIY
ncbi:hypothetical protein AGDE_12321 [Angomonas deanei]|uniref:CRAL/TRIO domain containing protein, putative n=1 Tax=Angomonas deanei TaxID=59799 RepID=A0A7G2C2R5_9TRYP|nr:hypothetical protein AGDE_12321 [Angomonas deanei]CAD2214030.1 CRAL/TRIO domain containing protein, putative [Angomonas deanei]|eukprot:EPY24489.1 hypothetical protein AGDE_12321 [Angomonas deanei]